MEHIFVYYRSHTIRHTLISVPCVQFNTVLRCLSVLLHNQCFCSCTPLNNQCCCSCTPLPLDTDANCCTQQPQLHSATHCRGNTKQGTINISTDQTDKENGLLLCSCHFNWRTVLPTAKWSLNTAYQTEHIAIKLRNTRHITQTVNCLKLF